MKKKTVFWIVVGFFGLCFSIALVTRPILSRIYSDDPSTAWTYSCKDLGFTLVLPSNDWKVVHNPDGPAAFRHAKLPAQVGVYTKQGSREDYLSLVEADKHDVDHNPAVLVTPKHVKGTLQGGKEFAFYTTVTTSVEPPSGRIYYGQSSIYLSQRNLIVTIMFEGVLNMISDTGESVQESYYENASREICLSLQGSPK